MNPTTAETGALVHAVRTVLAGAFAHLLLVGWRRTLRRPTCAARPRGVRLVDALNYASAHAGSDTTTHRLAFACAAMAIELHAGVAAHEMLPPALADAYLSPDTDDATLHRLDASIMVRCNNSLITGTADAAELLRLAEQHADQIIAAQLRYGRVAA